MKDSKDSVESFIQDFFESIITICESSGSYMVTIRPSKELYVLGLLKTLYNISENEVNKIKVKGKTIVYVPPDKLIIRLGSGKSLRDAKLFLYNVFSKNK